ncbi:hypothetical protein IW262DRAFT_1317905 [Armillaria fumosa]|nr:hypothetical protein IW262DRAFT_1317905 [Armillaria fumosa]
MYILMGVLVTAVILAIVWVSLDLYQDCCESEQHILPVHQPQQHLPVDQLSPSPALPSRSHRLPPLTPLLYEHQPVYQSTSSPSHSYRSSLYTPSVHQPEHHQPVYKPSPGPPPPSPSQSYQSSPCTPPVHQPEQHQPVYQSPPSPSPPPPPQSYRSSPYIPPVHQPEQHQPHDNQQDQSNEYYIDLRARAYREAEAKARCFSERHEAYDRGDRAAARDLSNQGKFHNQNMQQLDKEASDWFYSKNNRDRKPGEIDLHDLYVNEAIAYTDVALEEAKRRGDSEMRIIVGKGLHSWDREGKLGPAIKDLMRIYQLSAELDPSNCGVLVVELNGSPPIHHRQHPGNSHRRSRRRRQRGSNIGA